MSNQTLTYEQWLSSFRALESKREGGKLSTEDEARNMYEGNLSPEDAVNYEDNAVNAFASDNGYTLDEARAEAARQTAEDQGEEDSDKSADTLADGFDEEEEDEDEGSDDDEDDDEIEQDLDDLFSDEE